MSEDNALRSLGDGLDLVVEGYVSDHELKILDGGPTAGTTIVVQVVSNVALFLCHSGQYCCQRLKTVALTRQNDHNSTPEICR